MGRLVRTPIRNGPTAPSLELGSVVLVALSGCCSALAYGALPDRMRIHWTFGTGPYVGVEFAPTWIVLAAFPLLLTGFVAGSHLLWSVFEKSLDGIDDAAPVYWGTVVAVLAFWLVVQLVIVVANL